jgi:hypothetical protein
MKIHDGLNMVVHRVNGHVVRFLYGFNDASAYFSVSANVNVYVHDHCYGCICALSFFTHAYDHRASDCIPYGHAIFIHDGDVSGRCDHAHGCRRTHEYANHVFTVLSVFSYDESGNNYGVLLHANRYAKHS